MAIMFKIDSEQPAIYYVSAGDQYNKVILLTYSMHYFLKIKFTKNRLFNVSDKKEFADTSELKRDYSFMVQDSKYSWYTGEKGDPVKICEAGLIDLFSCVPETLYFSNINAMKINNK